MSMLSRVKKLEDRTGGDVIFVITDTEFLPTKEDCTHAMLGWLDVEPRRVDREEDESVLDF